MAAAIKALNARIRANPVTDYFCSTRECYSSPRLLDPGGKRRARKQGTGARQCDFASQECEEAVWRKKWKTQWLTANLPVADFWGPASNFGIPIAAVMDTQKDPEMYVPTT